VYNPTSPTHSYLTAPTMSGRSLLVIFFSLTATALMSYSLAPGVFWAESDTGDYGFQTQIGLWRSCNSTELNGTAGNATGPRECVTFGKPTSSEAKDAVHDLRKGERDGAAAAVVLSALFALITFCFAVCQSKWCTVFNSLLATILAYGAVGLWVAYKSEYIDNTAEFGNRKFNFGNGFFFACGAAAAMTIACVASCGIRKSGEYDALDAGNRYLA